MNFIGRAHELQKMEQCFQTERQEVLLIYGRRRIGKSELVKQFLRQHEVEGIYYECKQTSEMNNVETLSALLSERDGLPPLGFSGMEQLLDFLFQKACEKKMILVLDEYPYMRQAVKGMDSILQSLIDKYAERSRMKLVLCGSFVETMQSLLLVHQPLYGRMTMVLRLQAMDYFEAAQFYPSFSQEDKVRLYSVFGGIPYYNRFVDDSLSVKDNILRLLVEPGARLENEISFYYHQTGARLLKDGKLYNIPRPLQHSQAHKAGLDLPEKV